MQDFINQVVGKLGTDEDTAKAATGGLLDIIQKHADPDDAGDMLAKLPGAVEMLKQAPAEDSGGGGLMGSIGGALGALGGGDSPLGALSALTKSGLSLDKIGDFASLFIQFIKPKLGADLLGRLVKKVPGLGTLVG